MTPLRFHSEVEIMKYNALFIVGMINFNVIQYILPCRRSELKTLSRITFFIPEPEGKLD